MLSEPVHTRTPVTGRRPWSTTLRLALIPFLLLVTLVVWAYASPAGASPDDDFHMASIWCGTGIHAGECQAGPTAAARTLPKTVVDARACFAFQSGLSASCQREFPGQTVVTERLNTTGLYPPVFYAVMNLFVTPNVFQSVVVMRVVSSLLFTVLAALTWLLLPRSRRSAFAWALAITIVPFGLFIVPSLNGSSWAVISAGIVFSAMLGYFETTGRRRVGLAIVAAVAALVGGGARGDAALYAIVAVVAASFLSMNRSRSFVRSLIVPAAITVMSLLLYATASQGGDALGGLTGGDPANPTGKTLILENLFQLPSLWMGVFGGGGGLGWIDTPLPAIVWVTSLCVFAAVGFRGLQSMNLRKLLVLIALAAMLVVIPSYILYRSHAVVGQGVQPRYMIPIVMMIATVALTQVGATPVRLNRATTWLVVASLAIAASIALLTNMRRYISGLGFFSLDLNHGEQWWWNGLPSPEVVWIVGTLAFTGALVLLATAPTAGPDALARPTTADSSVDESRTGSRTHEPA